MKYSPAFRNIANTDIPYTHPVNALRTDAGAYEDGDVYGSYVVNNPMGDAIIVVSNPILKKPYKKRT